MKQFIFAISLAIISTNVAHAASTTSKLGDIINGAAAAGKVVSTAGGAVSKIVGAARDRGARAIQGSSVTVKDLEVNSTNTVNGSVKAKENSVVSIGETSLTNTKANTVKIRTTNTLNSIEASGTSTVAIGQVGLENFSGNKVDITTDNTVRGKIEARSESYVGIGGVHTQ